LPRLQYRVAYPQSQRTHAILQTTQQANGYAIRLFRADTRSKSATRTRAEKYHCWKVYRKAAAACNKHIAKIAALPSFENICYFCRVLLVGKCVCEPQLRQYAGRCTQPHYEISSLLKKNNP